MRLDFVEKTITITKKELEKVSEEKAAKIIDIMLTMLPHFSVVIDCNQKGNPNVGLTYKVMEDYISQNAPEMLDGFYDFRKVVGYIRTAQWFRKTFPEY